MMIRSLSMGCVAIAGLAACATAPDAPASATAVALIDTSGAAIGTVRMWETPGAVSFRIEAKGLTVGTKAVHVHTVGRCDAPAFTSAGPHWNPNARKHGLANPAGPHAGDLPNVAVSANGTLRQTLVLSGASFAALRDGDGAALVIHAKADDNVTDPSGNSGDRIACANLFAG